MTAAKKGLAQKKVASHKDKCFSLLGFLNLEGDAVVFCTIFSGVIQNPQTETGLDFSKPIMSDTEDPVFFDINIGERRAFPGGPVCNFRRSRCISVSSGPRKV